MVLFGRFFILKPRVYYFTPTAIERGRYFGGLSIRRTNSYRAGNLVYSEGIDRSSVRVWASGRLFLFEGDMYMLMNL